MANMLAAKNVSGNGLVIEMVSIPGGTFLMGDLSGESYDKEKPVHLVTVPAFRLGKYEVTFAQWDACVADGGCNGYSPDDEGWGRGDRPVINVSWYDVQSFIDWLNDRTGGNFRLPSEAEWEYAARAGTTTRHSWGDDIGNNLANCINYYCGDRWDYTAPTGSFPPNPWGLHDMYGNVWEWTQDCSGNGYEGAPTDGSAWTSDDYDCRRWRRIRGGSWYDKCDSLYGPSDLRASCRRSFDRYLRRGFIGFRLARDE